MVSNKPPNISSRHRRVSRRQHSGGESLQDMISDLEDELGGHFLDVALAMMCPAHVYDAHCVRKAIVVSEQIACCVGAIRLQREVRLCRARARTRRASSRYCARAATRSAC